MVSIWRNPRVVIGAAFFITFIAAVDTTYAQAAFTQMVTVPDNFPALTISPGSPGSPGTPGDTQNPGSPAAQNGITLDANGVSSVDAKTIALVSLEARQVDLARTPDGAKLVAKNLIADSYDWNSTQVSCLTQLWDGESHWNFKAHNYRSGAHGIAQALPATKMEIISTDWRTNPLTQIKWGLTYIKARYGTPCKALLKKHRSHYY
jgi:hypothetical protein